MNLDVYWQILLRAIIAVMFHLRLATFLFTCHIFIQGVLQFPVFGSFSVISLVPIILTSLLGLLLSNWTYLPTYKPGHRQITLCQTCAYRIQPTIFHVSLSAIPLLPFPPGWPSLLSPIETRAVLLSSYLFSFLSLDFPSLFSQDQTSGLLRVIVASWLRAQAQESDHLGLKPDSIFTIIRP